MSSDPILSDAVRVAIDPRKLTFHRTRAEPTEPEELRVRNERRLALFDSWYEKPINEIFVRDGDYAIADGNERVSGALLRGVAEITVTLLPATTTDAELDRFSVLTDVHKTKLKPFELASVIKRFIETTGAKKGEAAATFRIDNGYLTRLMSIFDCPLEVQEAIQAGLLTVDQGYRVSLSPQPLETSRLFQQGQKDKAVRSAKKPKASATVRSSKPLKCPLPTGAVVTVTAEESSLEDALEALGEASKLVKAAIAKQLSPKTAMKYWADIAAASA